MKVIFETTDLGDARLLTNAARYKQVLVDLDNYLRSGVKHDNKPWDDVRTYLYELLREADLTLEDDYEPTEESCSGGACGCGGRASTTDGDGGDGEDGGPTGPLVRLGR